jgi:predicted nucleic acid-binding protein
LTEMKVVLDACVLYSAPLRDFLMHLSLLDVIEARWTDLIHEEWIRSVSRDRPDLDRERLERTRRLMDQNTRDSLITGFEHLIPKLSLPDADDRHVLAAAIHCEADAIITFNLKDFPEKQSVAMGCGCLRPTSF